MSGWLIALFVLAAIYAIGFLGVWAFTRSAKLALIWPLWLLFGLFGNIQ